MVAAVAAGYETITVCGVEFPYMAIDYETYYGKGYGLRTMTTADYIHDEKFQTIGVSLRMPWGEYVWLEHEEFEEFLAKGGREFIALCALGAHNAHFDGYVLGYRYATVPGLWICTLSQGRALHGVEVGNSLAKLAVHYEVGVKGDEVVKAFGKRREDFTRAEWLQYGKYSKHDSFLHYGIFHAMPRFPDSELQLIDWTIRCFTEPVLVLDEDRMEKFKEYEIAKKQALLNRIKQDKSVLLSNEKFALLLISLGVDPPMKWSIKKERDDYAFARKDPEFMELETHENPEVVAAVQARLGIKSTMNETRAIRFLRLGKDQRPLGLFMRYYGGHTGRWSGGDKMNPQNLERTKKGFPYKGVIRKCLRAPPGKKIIVADSGQIEARGTCWLCGQEDQLEAFRQGRDVYSEFASVAYGRHVDGKKREGFTPTPEDEQARLVGKTCILGLGYGMGWAKFASTLLSGPMGADPIAFTRDDVANMRVDYQLFMSKSDNVVKAQETKAAATVDVLAHCAVCWHLVNIFRKKNSAITHFWYEVGPALLDSMLNGEELELGPLRTMKNALVLPNGMLLRYPDLACDDRGEWTYTGEKHGRPAPFTGIWGGSLLENIIQALARIVVSDQLLAAISVGLHVVLMAHDENILCEDEKVAVWAAQMLQAIMKTPPDWCSDLPLSADVGSGDNYGEAK